MKKQMTMVLALCGLAAGVSVHAVQKPQVVTSETMQKAAECSATKLSVEEMAFAAKLSDSNRKAFIEKLTVEQRKLAMDAVKNASIANAADEAVAKIVNSQALEQQEKAAIASSEDSQTEAPTAE